jgi:hypothetical protein
MNGEEALEQLPLSLRRLMAFERFHLYKPDMRYSGANDSAFDVKYFPTNSSVFELPCFWIDHRKLYMYRDSLADIDSYSSFAGNGPAGCMLYAIHPTAAATHRNLLARIGHEINEMEHRRVLAVPTSSTRTVLAWREEAPNDAVFIKLSLHSPVLGDRHLYRHSIERSVGMSTIAQASARSTMATIGYFPESFAIIPRDKLDSGIIFRTIPKEISEDRCLVVPLFSLLGTKPSGQPMLPDLVERSNMTSIDFIEEILCAPFAQLWLELSMGHGVILEAHAQNMLLCLTPNMRPLGRFFYRDFEGLQIDWELRAIRRLETPAGIPSACAWHITYNTLGYPWSQMAWYKLYCSLQDYMHRVLDPLNNSVCDWTRLGILSGPKIERYEITEIFSRHIFDSVERMFRINISDRYNIYHSLSKFVALLLKLRLRSGNEGILKT